MTGSANGPTLHVAARDIPVPNSVSLAARAIIAMPRPPVPPYPALEDSAGWRAYAAAMEAAMLPVMRQRACFEPAA